MLSRILVFVKSFFNKKEESVYDKKSFCKKQNHIPVINHLFISNNAKNLDECIEKGCWHLKDNFKVEVGDYILIRCGTRVTKKKAMFLDQRVLILKVTEEAYKDIAVWSGNKERYYYKYPSELVYDGLLRNIGKRNLDALEGVTPSMRGYTSITRRFDAKKN